MSEVQQAGERAGVAWAITWVIRPEKRHAKQQMNVDRSRKCLCVFARDME